MLSALFVLLVGLVVASLIRVAGRVVGARLAGVSVDTVVLGLGPGLFRSKGASLQIKLVPIWVSARFGSALEVPGEPGGASRGRRALFLLAGPTACYLLAAALSFGAFVQLGTLVPTTTVQSVQGPARAAGMLAGDRIVRVDGDPISRWDEIVADISGSEGRALTIGVRRGSAEFALRIEPVRAGGRWMAGIRPKQRRAPAELTETLARAVRAPVSLAGGATGYAPAMAWSGLIDGADRPALSGWALGLASLCSLVAFAALLPLPGFDGLLLILLAMEGDRRIRWPARAVAVARSPRWGVPVLLVLLAAGRGLATRPAPSGAERSAAVDEEPPPLSADRLPRRVVGPPLTGRLVALPLEPTQAEIAHHVATVESEQWYSVFLAGEKVGFLRGVSRKTRGDEPGGYLIALDSAMRIVAEGAVENSYLFEARYYDTTPPFSLVVVETAEIGRASTVERRIAFDDRGGKLTETADGVPSESRRVAGTAETLADALPLESLDVARAREGDVARYVSYSEELLTDDVLDVRVASKQRRVIAGVEVPVATIEATSRTDPMSRTMVFAGDGRLAELTVGNIMRLRLASRDAAIHDVKGGAGPVLAGVPVDRPLGDAAAIESLRLVVQAPEGFSIPESARQRVTARGDREFLVALGRGPGDEVTAQARAEALEPRASIDSDSPEVRRAASDVTRGLSGDRERAEALLDFVFESLDKTYQSNLSTATQVLRRRAGDCSEHSMLFVALSRAAGMAARQVWGLVYAGDAEQRVAWHVWAEVELDGRWQPMDPVFGETDADATHLALSTGLDTRWVRALGGLRIRVAE